MCMSVCAKTKGAFLLQQLSYALKVKPLEYKQKPNNLMSNKQKSKMFFSLFFNGIFTCPLEVTCPFKHIICCYVPACMYCICICMYLCALIWLSTRLRVLPNAPDNIKRAFPNTITLLL